MNNSKRLMLIIAGIVVAVILLAAFASLRGKETPVRADVVVRSNISNNISTNGKIQPIDNFEAHAPTATTVTRILVHEGDHIKAGQLLMQLDDSDARAQAAKALAQLKAAEANRHIIQSGGTHEEVLTTQSSLVKARTELEAANRNLAAMQQLEQRGAASPAEVEDARNKVKRAQADVDLLQQKETSRYSRPEMEKVNADEDQARVAYQAALETMRQLNVRAPREGTVYSIPVHPGNYVNAGDLLVQVADLRTVRVIGYVDEPDVGRLAPGLKVRVTWDALPGRAWQGTLTHIPTTVTQLGTRTVGDIACTVDNADLKLLPNVNVNVAVTTAQDDNVLTVAREAIRQDDGMRYVFQVVNGELKRRTVTTSISNPTRIEITSGLPENAVVALNALNNRALVDGMAVRVVQQ